MAQTDLFVFVVALSGEKRRGREGSEGRAGQRDPKRCGDDDRPSGQPAQEQAHHPDG